MKGTKLPIDLVPDTNPPRFRWRQMVDTPAGYRVIEQEGMLPPSIDRSVEELVKMAKQLLADNVLLRGQIEGMAERVVAQSELLSRKAEVSGSPPATATVGKKGR